MAPAIVSACQIAAAEAGLGNTRVVSGDAQAPDPAIGSYDVVASWLVLFFLPLETRFEDVAQSSHLSP